MQRKCMNNSSLQLNSTMIGINVLIMQRIQLCKYEVKSTLEVIRIFTVI